MKTKLIDKAGKAGKEIELPSNFSADVRKDILLKVFEATKRMQVMGSKIGAGAGYSASGILRHRRHVWKTTYGKGISRIPRKIFSRSGSSFNWEGATVSNTRGGRKAHPPKTEKKLFKKINKKEFLIAMNSALAGSVGEEYLKEKYGKSTKILPIIFEAGILDVKTKEFLAVIKGLFGDAYENVLKKKSVRAGKGKTRGRKYKSNAGLLFVVGKDEKMNRKGIDIVRVGDLGVGDLAPNGVAGRFVVYTEKAVKEIGEVFK